MSLINLSSSAIKGMKKMHAGGQPPLLGGDTSMFRYLTDAGIPYSRLHDVDGAYGKMRYVDVPNIFRDFDADVDDPASYDFTFTDFLVKALVDAGVEPYFRFGVTIENQMKIKAYRIFPPQDYKKWAQICEHIIRHYTEGWADGFEYNITYWEIWNEPDNEQCWAGTPEQFYELYDVAAKHLKSAFPHLKIGGYASSGFYAAIDPDAKAWYKYILEFFRGFISYIKEHGSPIDFFSWHSYADTASNVRMDAWLKDVMIENGYADVELHLNEWDPFAEEYGTAHHSAEVAATLIAMQRGHEDVCCIYDMRATYVPYCPLFDVKTHKPIHAYYSMVAFDQLYRLGTEIECVCDTNGLYAIAASDGQRCAMMISNLTGAEQSLEISGAELSDARYHVIDGERLLSWSAPTRSIKNNEVLLIEWSK